MGVKTSYVDLSGAAGPANLRASMTPRTALVMVESPTNPMMRICDLQVTKREHAPRAPGRPSTRAA